MNECRVCRSTKHTGVYYGAFVCSGCKVFFMRTVVSGMGFVCHVGGICSTPAEIIKCRACRFGKCIQMGMRSDLVGIRSNRRYDDPSSPEHFAAPSTSAGLKHFEQKASPLSMPNESHSQFPSVVPYFEKNYHIFRPSALGRGGSPIGISFTEALKETPNEPLRVAEKLMALETFCNYDLGIGDYREEDGLCCTVTLPDALENPLIIMARRPAFHRTTRTPKDISDYSKIFHRSVVYYIDWVAASPEIQQLSQKDMLNFVAPRMSIMHFSTIAYNTYKYGVNGYLMPDGYVYQAGDCWDPYVEGMINLVGTSIRPAMERLKLTGQEFCILKQIIMYSGCVNLTLSDEGKEVIYAARKKYEQLLVFYVEDVYSDLTSRERMLRVLHLLELKNKLLAGGLVEYEHSKAWISRNVLEKKCPTPCIAYDLHCAQF
ncbi:unnamed protein product, partial [Mesorhabditis belari]|uniref:Uncharacterized protein n=1 Tax=Mesorhabditis belari TaxID=2138241 RepID=A0AAF3F7I8_9BILA